MTNDLRRITLVSCNPRLTRRWQTSAAAKKRVIVTPTIAFPRALEFGQDVERIILDRSASAADYLALLSSLPPHFAGDALLIQADETGFLSSIGRGGDRVLYALQPDDIHFYLVTHELIDPDRSSLRTPGSSSTDIEISYANHFDSRR